MGSWDLRKSDQDHVVACGKMGPRLARRQGTSQEGEWRYQVHGEEVEGMEQSMRDEIWVVYSFEA
jgi:hypothetical protein